MRESIASEKNHFSLEVTFIQSEIPFSDYLAHKQQEHSKALQWLLDTAVGRNLNPRQADILSKAIKQQGRIFTVKEIMNDYRISENSARADLKGLVAAGALTEAKDTGRLKLFIALPDIPSRLNGK